MALLSHSTFGNPMHATGNAMRDAVAMLDARGVDFEYDGEMSPDVALDPSYPRALSVLPADRAGQRAGDAGAALRRTSPRAWRRGWAAAAPSGRC